MSVQNEPLRPVVGTALTGQGVVLAHQLVIDSLLRLMVRKEPEKRWPEASAWLAMLPPHDVKTIIFDEELQVITIYYKELGHE